ncbi:DsrE family protein [Chitinophaga sp. RCC_12]|uniref:DsrE family protein n=1 Tax=Chitinophaga sp. RCC_12 TaxID=3239226 RepID=UPI0035249103
MQVVFQITSGERDAQLSMLGQLNNLLHYTSERQTRVAIEVVVHGHAWNLLLPESHPFPEKIASLQGRSVRFLICQNTLNSRQLAADQLFPFVEVVPAAIAHLIERQQEGWAYIRC